MFRMMCLEVAASGMSELPGDPKKQSVPKPRNPNTETLKFGPKALQKP